MQASAVRQTAPRCTDENARSYCKRLQIMLHYCKISSFKGGIPLFDSLRGITFGSMIVRLLMAMVVGAILGIERGRKKRPAGFRTYMLVCIGGAMVSMTGQYMLEQFGGTDIARLPAQVISGIGFLGAGAIVVTGHNQVRGITTAAALWTAACLGVAIGIGFYEGALLAGLAIIAIMELMHPLDNAIHRHTRMMDVYVELDGSVPVSDFLNYVHSCELELVDLQMNFQHVNDATMAGLTFCVGPANSAKPTHHDMLNMLANGPGVGFIEEI